MNILVFILLIGIIINFREDNPLDLPADAARNYYKKLTVRYHISFKPIQEQIKRLRDYVKRVTCIKKYRERIISEIETYFQNKRKREEEIGDKSNKKVKLNNINSFFEKFMEGEDSDSESEKKKNKKIKKDEEIKIKEEDNKEDNKEEKKKDKKKGKEKKEKEEKKKKEDKKKER